MSLHHSLTRGEGQGLCKSTFLHNTVSSPWNCSKCFTLHPLTDLFLYTSPPGRPVPLHFTPWQTCSFTLHPLTDLFLYTSPPGRPVPLHFTPWQTCSFQRHLNFSGKHSGVLHLLHENYSFIYPPMSIARYSFIPLSEMRQRGANKICESFETAATEFEPEFSRLEALCSNHC